ncbi:hypothetical protein ACHAXR_005972 [Thalassiosira sp. AJA248-18]
MSSAPPPLPPPQQGAPPGMASGPTNTYNQSRSGGRGGGGRGNYNSGRGGGGRSNYNGGRGGGGGRGQGNNYGRGGGRGGGVNNSGGGRGGRGGGGGAPPINPEDPFDVPYGFLPAFLPGAASLVEQLDQRLLVILRDGRHLVGTLSTFDQFSNMVMMDTCERRILVVPREKKSKDGDDPSAPKTICYQTDIHLGLFIVRGDNVVLLGEVEDDEERNGGQIQFVSLEDFEQLEDEEAKRKEESGEENKDINWDFDMDLVA